MVLYFVLSRLFHLICLFFLVCLLSFCLFRLFRLFCLFVCFICFVFLFVLSFLFSFSFLSPSLSVTAPSFSVASKGVASIPVQFFARFLRPSTSTLVLSAARTGNAVGAPNVFNVKTEVTGIEPMETLQVEEKRKDETKKKKR